MATKERCSQCGVYQLEGWPSHYKRTHAKNVKHFLCRDCKKIKFLFDNPQIVEKRDKKREETIKKKEDRKRFANFLKTNPEAENWIKDCDDKNKERQKAYLKTEKGRQIYRDSMAKRRAKVLKALIEMDENEKQLIRIFYSNCPNGYHVDHIIPLSKGGTHCIANLQYLKAHLNLEKRNKLKIDEVKKLLGEEKISISWLQMKFKINFENARSLFSEIQLLLSAKNEYFP